MESERDAGLQTDHDSPRSGHGRPLSDRSALWVKEPNQSYGLGADQTLGRDGGLEHGRDSQSLHDQHTAESNDELIRPRKLLNPVRASRSHRQLHRELLISHKRGPGLEDKPELQRVLEQRNRELQVKQRREEVRRKASPLEQELLKRHERLDKLERELEEQRERAKRAPEFIRVKESLRRTASTTGGEKEV